MSTGLTKAITMATWRHSICQLFSFNFSTFFLFSSFFLKMSKSYNFLAAIDFDSMSICYPTVLNLSTTVHSPSNANVDGSSDACMNNNSSELTMIVRCLNQNQIWTKAWRSSLSVAVVILPLLTSSNCLTKAKTQLLYIINLGGWSWWNVNKFSIFNWPK